MSIAKPTDLATTLPRFTGLGKTTFSGLFCLGLILTASSCQRDGAGLSGEPVSWQELANFDEIAYRADGLARVGDLAAVHASRAELLAAGRAVTPQTVPSNVADPKQVESILADLTNLIDGLSTEIDDASLVHIVLGLHPVIEKLMAAAGMPHIHANEGPHDGFLHPVFDGEGKQAGMAEVKLHDDAGDLEVWLTRGGHEGEPWLLPVDTTLTLDFPDLTKHVTLAVRDRERNADESGSSTIHQGATAYFVFPADTGADASWLMGKEFAAKSELRFEDAKTGSFILRPHVHRKTSD